MPRPDGGEPAVAGVLFILGCEWCPPGL